MQLDDDDNEASSLAARKSETTVQHKSMSATMNALYSSSGSTSGASSPARNGGSGKTPPHPQVPEQQQQQQQHPPSVFDRALDAAEKTNGASKKKPNSSTTGVCRLETKRKCDLLFRDTRRSLDRKERQVCCPDTEWGNRREGKKRNSILIHFFHFSLPTMQLRRRLRIRCLQSSRISSAQTPRLLRLCPTSARRMSLQSPTQHLL